MNSPTQIDETGFTDQQKSAVANAEAQAPAGTTFDESDKNLGIEATVTPHPIAAPSAPIPSNIPAPASVTGQAPVSTAASASTSAPNATSAASPTTPATYQVAQGDTLQTLAQKYGTNVQAIMGANPNITNPNQTLTTGSTLNLPQKQQIGSQGQLGQAANAIYGAVSAVPDQSDTSAVTTAADNATSTLGAIDPMSAALAPFLGQMMQTVQAITAPGPTFQSLAQEYQSLASSTGLTSLQTQMMNLGNIMNGTPDDIRAEITAAGGFADESQVQAMATARNNVLIKQYNALSAQYDAASNYVSTTMQYSGEDQTNALNRINAVSGIQSTMASLVTTMISTAQKNYQSSVSILPYGYASLAELLSGDPAQQNYAESMLGLPLGTLSDPTKVQQLQNEYQATALQKEALAYFNANGAWPSWWNPVTNAPTGNNNSSGDTTTDVGAAVQAIVGNESGGDYNAVSEPLPSGQQSYGKYQILASNIPSWTQQYYGQSLTPEEFLNNPQAQDAVAQGKIGDLWNQYGNIQDVASVWFTGKPASESQGLTDPTTRTTSQQYIDKATSTFNGLIGGSASGSADQSTEVNDWVAAYKAGAVTSLSAVPKGIRNAVAAAIGGVSSDGSSGGATDGSGNSASSGVSYSPLAANRFTRAANSIVANFINLPQYQLTANGLPYLQRIKAAETDPGSVSDQELLDSLTKLSTAGNAISDTQVKLITDGRSLSDSVSVWQNRLTTGGVLSSDQRQQVLTLAEATYQNYLKGYQPVYDQVVSQLKDSGIPPQFWTIPNLTALNTSQAGLGAGTSFSAAPATQQVIFQGKTYNVDADGNMTAI